MEGSVGEEGLVRMGGGGEGKMYRIQGKSSCFQSLEDDMVGGGEL